MEKPCFPQIENCCPRRVAVDNIERTFYHGYVSKSHGVFVDTLRQQLGARAAGMCVEALERLGAHRSATVLLRIEGDRISYGIGPAKAAWDEVIVLGAINITNPISGELTPE